MDLEEALFTRRSVREYATEAVDDVTLRKLIDAAVQAPSAVNQQPWTFCVVRDKALLAQISQRAKTHQLGAAPQGHLSHQFQEILNDPQFDIFHEAPVLIVISSAADSPWAVENCALAGQNLMLAACAAGLGSCWIGLAQPWLRTPEGRQALGLAPGSVPVAPIVVGHPVSPSLPVPRKTPDIRWL